MYGRWIYYKEEKAEQQIQLGWKIFKVIGKVGNKHKAKGWFGTIKDIL